ncbi:hypothetical protein MACK_001057 [Theileria orientalis]|uniref:Uncharacterized protein n=1 Tax=Theileria orientalis TaxID=68886 RepID=A0A976QX38_THEOR|nr:hypothetical protein MACK_001057 [Theileria orientalis]
MEKNITPMREARKKLTNIDDHNFYVWYQKSHSTHNRYVITPAFSNYFTVNSIIMYGKVIPTEKFESVKEIHVFEHSNMHHYKVCIVTAKYNYAFEHDDITLHWLELRRNTNMGPEWKLVGRPDIEKSPDDFDNAYNISVLLDERISFYKDGDKWPPIEPKYPVNGSGNLYSTSEYDPDKKVITGITTPDLPGKEGGITPLVGGLIGSGAGVGIVGVTTGYVLYSHMGTITSALSSIFH